MSLLTICQNAADEIGLSRPAAIINATDATARRMLRYAVRTGRDFVKANVPYLFKEATLSTVAAQADYALPADFDHFVPFTQWNRSTNRRLWASIPSEWQELRSGLVSATIDDRFRIVGADKKLFLEPEPTSVETLAYEYVSKNYCESSGGTGQSVWTLDTDVGVIDEELFELGVIWRTLNRLGLPYAEEKAEFQIRLNQLKAQLPQQKVHLDGRSLARSNLPDADFPAA